MHSFSPFKDVDFWMSKRMMEREKFLGSGAGYHWKANVHFCASSSTLYNLLHNLAVWLNVQSFLPHSSGNQRAAENLLGKSDLVLTL